MKKDIIILFAVFLAICVIVMGTDIQTVDEYYLTHIDDIKPDSKTVTLTIQCKDVLKNYDKLTLSLQNSKYIPNNGIILDKTQYVLRDNDTVFDVLHRVVRYNKIQFDFQGKSNNSFGTAYVKSINYLYEFSCGETSGWIYKVNGEYPDCGCSDYKLSDGDNIEWVYTCSLGYIKE